MPLRLDRSFAGLYLCENRKPGPGSPANPGCSQACYTGLSSHDDIAKALRELKTGCQCGVTTATTSATLRYNSRYCRSFSLRVLDAGVTHSNAIRTKKRKKKSFTSFLTASPRGKQHLITPSHAFCSHLAKHCDIEAACSMHVWL